MSSCVSLRILVVVEFFQVSFSLLVSVSSKLIFCFYLSCMLAAFLRYLLIFGYLLKISSGNWCWLAALSNLKKKKFFPGLFRYNWQKLLRYTPSLAGCQVLPHWRPPACWWVGLCPSRADCLGLVLTCSWLGEPLSLVGGREDSEVVLASMCPCGRNEPPRMATASICVLGWGTSCLLVLYTRSSKMRRSAKPPFRSLPLCWDLGAGENLHVPCQEGLCCPRPCGSCTQAPLAFVARCSECPSSQRRTSRLGSPGRGSPPHA